MGGERKQYQVLIDPNALTRFGVTLKQVEDAVAASNENGTGGYLDRQGPANCLSDRLAVSIQSKNSPLSPSLFAMGDPSC